MLIIALPETVADQDQDLSSPTIRKVVWKPFEEGVCGIMYGCRVEYLTCLGSGYSICIEN